MDFENKHLITIEDQQLQNHKSVLSKANGYTIFDILNESEDKEPEMRPNNPLYYYQNHVPPPIQSYAQIKVKSSSHGKRKSKKSKSEVVFDGEQKYEI